MSLDNPEPVGVTYRFEYEFEHVDGDRETAVEIESSTTRNRETVDEDAFEKLVSENDVSRDEWRIEKVTIGFGNSPWSDWDELEETLESFQHVRNLRYDAPTPENYHPPRYDLSVETGWVGAVTEEIESYYSGLTVKRVSDNRLFVVVSPI